MGWAANRAHHADVGGMAPGSIPAEATEIYQEGLRIPPVLLTGAVEDMLCANSRTPDERRGDLDAQRGPTWSAWSGWRRSPAAPLGEVTDYGERRMRAALSDIPDGTWTFEDVLDSCGPTPEQQRPARMAVTLTIEGDKATFDFTGTDPQRPGNINAVEAVTVSAVSFALRSRHRPHHPRQRRRPATGDRDRPARLAGRGHAARGGRCRQRGGQPAGGRRVPGCPGRRPAPAAWARPTRGR